MLQKFIELTVKPFLLLAGILTSSVIVLLVSPEKMMLALFAVPYVQSDVIIIQHWALMITLVGILMIASAFINSWRLPVLSFALAEKILLVVTYLFYSDKLFASGFIGAVSVDFSISIYLLLYFYQKRKA